MLKRLSPIINLICITAIVHFAVKSFYQFAQTYVPTISEHRYTLKPKEAEPEEKIFPFSTYQIVNTRNIFNTKTEAMIIAENTPPTPTVSEEPPKPTELKLKLLGTVAGDKESAYAVIEDMKQRKEDLYREGDPIQDAMVLEIRRGSVILKVGEQKEILSMDDETGLGGQSQGNPAAVTPIPSLVKKVISRNDIQQSMRNINQLMSQVRIRPHFNRGRPDGLSVSNIKRESIFENMGLQNGDIIQSVNNTEIKTVDDVMSLYQQLQSATNINVQVKRNGKTENMEFSIR